MIWELKNVRILKEVLIYAYIWQIPFSWRLIWESSRLEGAVGFNEYTDVSLYIGEVLLFCALVIHVIDNKKYTKSILSSTISRLRQLFHVKQFILILSVVTLLVLNIWFSIDPLLSLVSFFHWIMLGIFVYFVKNIYVSRGTEILVNIGTVLAISLVLQLSISVFQVYLNHSVGLRLLNEPLLSVDSVNVAKSTIFENPQLRAYGTFPHPNVLAAFAVFCMMFGIVFSKLLHVKRTMFHVEQSNILIGVSFILVILSESKTAVGVCILIAACLACKHVFRQNMFHVKQGLVFVSILLVLVTPFLYASKLDIYTTLSTRLQQFQTQINSASLTIFGSGIGTYRLSYDGIQEAWWNLEPVHFVPLIIIVELGVLLSVVILIGMYKIGFFYVPRGACQWLILLLILYLLGTDHYAWDIYQGQILLSLALLLHLFAKENIKLDKHNTTCANMIPPNILKVIG